MAATPVIHQPALHDESREYELGKGKNSSLGRKNCYRKQQQSFFSSKRSTFKPWSIVSLANFSTVVWERTLQLRMTMQRDLGPGTYK